MTQPRTPITRKLTTAQQGSLLAHIESQQFAVANCLAALDNHLSGAAGIADEVSTAWNLLHDAERALAEQHAEVEANRGPSRVDPATAALIAANVD